MSITALSTIARMWNLPRCPPIDGQIKKMCYIYTMKFYALIKENEIMLFAGKWLGLEVVIVNEITQTQTDECQMFAL